MNIRRMAWATAAVVVAFAATTLAMRYSELSGKCPAYIPANGRLIAHAGGGLPGAIYTNSEEAMNLAVHHGFDLIELDFQSREEGLVIGHDGLPLSALTIPRLMRWLRDHPGVSIVTDFKTDNVVGLSKLSAAAGPLRDRFIPQIYAPAEFERVRELGFPRIILTVYRMSSKGDWQARANRLPLWAVTVPIERKSEAKGVLHPVFFHTVNTPIADANLYTDCLVPRSARRGA